MIQLGITLAPDGGLRLILPGGRGLNIGDGPSTIQFIRRILEDAAKGCPEPGFGQRGYIREFPTQHVIDIWKKQDQAAKVAAREEAAAAARAELAAKGIDLDALEITL